MKQWTVMLIPHDRGATQTLTLHSLHLWVPAGLLIALSFITAFFVQRSITTQGYVRELQEARRALELANAQKPAAPEPKAAQPAADVKALESRLRAEYEASLAKITAELGELYDTEAKARDITGLAPRKPPAATAAPLEKGQGGPAVGMGGIALASAPAAQRLESIIYGLSRPSADLLLQEIVLRRDSLGDLVGDMEAEVDRIERIPSAWPLANGAGALTSSFGHRIDPFTRRIRHHDGADLSARPGTPIVASARGKVVSSGWESDYGHVVRIDHGNGLQTWYAHMTRRDVAEGDAVDREQVIGTVGSTGRSTGPHLHYEVHVNGKPVDPEKYLTN